MIRFFFSLFALLLGLSSFTYAQYEAQIKNITQELGKKIAETGNKRIAVADFTDGDGAITRLGQFISEELNTYLPEAGHGFEVIDRNHVKTLMKENQLLSQKLTDPSTSAKLSKLAGIESLVYGSITPLGESVRVNIKILDLQRGVVLRSLVGNITRTADINRLLEEPGMSGERHEDSGLAPSVPSRSAEASMQKNECESSGGFGHYRFQNLFKEPILLYKLHSSGSTIDLNILIASRDTGSTPRIKLWGDTAREYVFYFKTTKAPVEEGFLTLTVSKCKSKFMSLSPSNLHLTKAKTE